VHEHEHAPGVEGVDVSLGGSVVEAGLHQQLLELAPAGDPCALLALVLSDDDVAFGVGEAALGRGVRRRVAPAHGAALRAVAGEGADLVLWSDRAAETPAGLAARVVDLGAHEQAHVVTRNIGGEEVGPRLRRVLEDPAEIAEADRRVDAFGHRGGLQARGRAAAFGGVMDVSCGERGAEPSPSCRLDRGHVVDPAVTVVVEGDRGRDARAGVPRPEV
jgi:hypothetical protein